MARVPTLMWEARAVDGGVDELVEFVCAHADPQAQVFRSSDARVVVIDPTGRGLSDVPARLLARPAHVWRFEAVPR
jgi:hypothetical protein